MEFGKTRERTILQKSSSCMWISTRQIFIVSQIFRIYHQNKSVEDIKTFQIVSGALIPDEITQHCLNCIEIGERCFVTNRLNE